MLLQKYGLNLYEKSNRGLGGLRASHLKSWQTSENTEFDLFHGKVLEHLIKKERWSRKINHLTALQAAEFYQKLCQQEPTMQLKPITNNF